MAATAALGAVLLTGTAQVASAQAAPAAQQAAQPGQPAAKQKVAKDTAEADLANAVLVDIEGATPNWQKAITDLNNWAQKYPQSDWKNDWPFYYLQASVGLGQFDKALDYAAQVLAMDVPTVFPSRDDQVKIYYNTAAAAAAIKSGATPEELASGKKGATALLDFIPTFFTAANKPAKATDAQWNQARDQLTAAGNNALLAVAIYPGDQAVQKKDFPGAEAAYRKALQDYPNSGIIAYKLGSAIVQEANPDKYSQALYFIARAAAMQPTTDPTKGGITDATQRTQIDNFLRSTYVRIHGGDDGLAELKQQALASPFPPDGFKIKTASEVALEKQKEFAEKNPQVAMWMNIKGMLTGTDADNQFASSLKDSMVKGLNTGERGLIGTIVSGEPACNSKTVQVSVPVPGSTATPTAEITMKLDKPLKGKPIAGTQIKWDGVPSSFTKDPFMLTMDVDQADIDGMAVDTCTPPKVAPKKPGTGKAPTTKKSQ
jgi:tetratricopeptide (TPR) repeat protein